jgi:hypothetical protein
MRPRVGQHAVGGQHVVAGQTVRPHQEAEAPAEREPCDAGGGDRSAGRGQPV